MTSAVASLTAAMCSARNADTRACERPPSTSAQIAAEGATNAAQYAARLTACAPGARLHRGEQPHQIDLSGAEELAQRDDLRPSSAAAGASTRRDVSARMARCSRARMPRGSWLRTRP